MNYLTNKKWGFSLMALVSDNIINATRTLANTLGVINEGTKYLLQAFDPQNKNLFEMLLLPEPPPPNAKFFVKPASTLEYVTRSFLDNVVTKLHIQSIDVGFNSLEYARYDYIQGVLDFSYIDEITITFIETELGVVRNFLNNWLKLTVKDDPNGGVIFADNQWLGRKKAIIIPQTSLGLPSSSWIEMRGLRYKQMENWTLSQSETDPMYISVNFALDRCWLSTPL